MLLTRKFKFDASHTLDWHQGKCKNLHGHTFNLEIQVNGPLNENSVVIDFIELKQIVTQHILDKLDHSHLNDTIQNPTAENTAIWIWNNLKPHLPILSQIKLCESQDSCVIYNSE